MYKFLFTSIITTMLGISNVYAAEAVQLPKPLTCTTKENVEKLIQQGEFFAFSRGTAPDNKSHEIWLNVKNQIIVVAFDKPPNNDSKLIKEVCIISMTNDEVYNGETVDMLHKAFNKSGTDL